MNISKHITFKEATKSLTAERYGIDNNPNEMQLINMKLLAENVFEPLRSGLGNNPINIASFFRSFGLNKMIGGAIGSQHMADKGAAMDIDVDNSNYYTNAVIFNHILEFLDFDQLIWEMGDSKNPAWVHVSFNKGHNRNEVLIAYKSEENKTKYKNYVL